MNFAESNFNHDFIAFVIDDKVFAVPILSLQGIIGNPCIVEIPQSPDFVVGIFHLNNFYIPILDLRTILDKPNLIYPNKTCTIIVRVSFKKQEKLVGFIVDSLCSINHIKISDIDKLPSYENNDFIEGISYKEDKMILLLNLEKIINKSDVIYFLNQFWKTNEGKSKRKNIDSNKN